MRNEVPEVPGAPEFNRELKSLTKNAKWFLGSLGFGVAAAFQIIPRNESIDTYNVPEIACLAIPAALFLAFLYPFARSVIRVKKHI